MKPAKSGHRRTWRSTALLALVGQVLPDATAVPAAHDAGATALRAQSVVYRQASDLAVGNKGEHAIDVSRPAPQCGAVSPVFDGARIEITRQRFGKAMIVSSPPSGCTRCSALRVRWFHEPTGYLDFTVTARWKFVEGRCNHD
ncbi:MAG: hypothetical protein AB7P21_17495 [Lautropia sp.]